MVGRRRSSPPPPPPALETKMAPDLFRCPISLEVMRSPVSLCTGVTYDRASIQRWLDSGHNVCPATMQPLPTTDLVPNLTLRRLIHRWSNGHDHVANNAVDITRAGAAPAVVGALVDTAARLDALEAGVAVLHSMLFGDAAADDRANRKIVVDSLAGNEVAVAVALAAIMRDAGVAAERKTDAVKIFKRMLGSCDGEKKAAIAETVPELVSALLNLITVVDSGVVISCVSDLVERSRRARAEFVGAGGVEAARKVLESAPTAKTAARVLRLLEHAVASAEGRAAVRDAGDVVPAVVRWMMKGGKDGTEAAVRVLWTVCCRFKDPKVVAAVVAADGVATKLLLVMQSTCSTAARQMAADLLKELKAVAGDVVVGYDSQTSHILPF